MLSLFGSAMGYVIDLADDNTEGMIGVPPLDQAQVTLTCPGKQTGSSTMKNLEQDYSMQQSWMSGGKDIEIELMHLPDTCVDRQAHLEPCYPHDPTSKNYFGCQFKTPTGMTALTEGSKPWFEFISVDQVRVGKIAKMNCSVPAQHVLFAISDYDYQSGTISAEVNVAHFTNGTMSGTNLILPHHGDAGSNVLTMINVLAPPHTPSPPASPPTPWNPVPTGYDVKSGHPGWMYDQYINTIRSMDLNGLPNFPKWQMCYSTRRSDRRHASQFHRQCDAPPEQTANLETLHFYKLDYGSTHKMVGAYTRVSWGGANGYAGDADATLFQVFPTVFKSVAGSGPYTGSSNAIYRYSNYGPTFGSAHDFHITSNMRTGYSNLGHAYKCRVGNYGQAACRNDFAGHYNGWSIDEMEIWTAEVNNPTTQAVIDAWATLGDQGLVTNRDQWKAGHLPQSGETLSAAGR